jgi:hypothetical protein
VRLYVWHVSLHFFLGRKEDMSNCSWPALLVCVSVSFKVLGCVAFKSNALRRVL